MEEIEIKPTNAFTERFAEGASIGTSGGGLIILDFLKPEVSLMGEKNGKITGYRGELRPDVRIYLSPKVTKKLCDALNIHIERYEKEYGEIK